MVARLSQRRRAAATALRLVAGEHAALLAGAGRDTAVIDETVEMPPNQGRNRRAITCLRRRCLLHRPPRPARPRKLVELCLEAVEVIVKVAEGAVERLDALDAFFSRWGAATVAVGRLVPFARPLVPLMAGASGWPYRRFLAWNLLGTGVFAVAFTVLGYAAYATAERVVEIGGDAALIVIPLALALAALAILVRGRATAARE